MRGAPSRIAFLLQQGIKKACWRATGSAEREGFEPSVRLPVQRFSRPSRSTTPASFLKSNAKLLFFSEVKAFSPKNFAKNFGKKGAVEERTPRRRRNRGGDANVGVVAPLQGAVIVYSVEPQVEASGFRHCASSRRFSLLCSVHLISSRRFSHKIKAGDGAMPSPAGYVLWLSVYLTTTFAAVPAARTT